MAMHGTDPERWLDRPKNVDRVWYALVAVCLALFLGDALYHKHIHFSYEGWFGFYGLYGFVAFFFAVLAGKQLRKLLMRGEDYYDR